MGYAVLLPATARKGVILMFACIAQNLGTILVSAVLLVIVIAIVRYLIRQKKQGKSSCGAGCAHCANAGCCHHQQ